MPPDEDDDQLLDLLDLLVQEPPPGDPDAGPFSETHRASLRGREPDIHPSTERSRHRAIRDSIRDSWQDLAIAFENLDPEDRVQLQLRQVGNRDYLEDHAGDDEIPGPPELFWSFVVAGESPDDLVVGTGGIRQVIGLGFLSLYDALVDEQNWSEAQYTSLLESLVAGALQDTLVNLGNSATVDVDINIDDIEGVDDVEGGEEREIGDEIESLEELRLRYALRELEPDQFWAFLGIDPVTGTRTDIGPGRRPSDGR